MTVRAVVVAVMLMQCCSVILAARPLLPHAAAGDDGHGFWQWKLEKDDAGATIMEVLPKGPPSVPGSPNCGHFQNPTHPPCPPSL
ncbi:hypothetical protein BS78_01G470900 [Paspalum vaginatum]|uniref:Uncharacterized protein n=1 Tax=Paspalum vaginatum TaxID=158149 RepID=A0A9W7XA36_9POAL|nr:hypothetical protein BS78_K327600 [Paspalum vaginatum]KAJ1298665.1 hypothetical protein BS78_01G470900 [Paspalum vaginatum]